MRDSNRKQHASRDFARVSAFLFPVKILSSNRDIRTLCSLDCRRNVDKRRTNHYLVPVMSGNQRQKITEEVAGLVGCLVHLPVGGNGLFSHSDPLSIFNGEMTFVLCNLSIACT